MSKNIDNINIKCSIQKSYMTQNDYDTQSEKSIQHSQDSYKTDITQNKFQKYLDSKVRNSQKLNEKIYLKKRSKSNKIENYKILANNNHNQRNNFNKKIKYLTPSKQLKFEDTPKFKKQITPQESFYSQINSSKKSTVPPTANLTKQNSLRNYSQVRTSNKTPQTQNYTQNNEFQMTDIFYNSTNNNLIQNDVNKDKHRSSSMKLYKNIAKNNEKQQIDNIEYIRNLSHPAPDPFKVPLQQKIYDVLGVNDFLGPQSQIKKKSTYQQVKQSFKTNQIQNYPFINPKQHDIFVKEKSKKIVREGRSFTLKNNKQSKIKQQYGSNYKKIMLLNKPDHIPNVEDHPLMVDALLYSQLSASAMASHTWHSVKTKRNMEDLRTHPNIENYPHSPRAINNIQEIQKIITNKVTKQVRNSQQFEKKQKIEHFRTQDDLILDTKETLETYLQNIINAKQNNKTVYNKNLQEFNHICDFAQENFKDNNKFNIDEADQNVSYIKQQQKLFKRDQEIQNNLKSRERREKLTEKEGNVDVEIEYTPMPFHNQNFKEKYENDNIEDIGKQIGQQLKYSKKADHTYDEGAFDEHDVFQARPVAIPKSNLKYNIRHE